MFTISIIGFFKEAKTSLSSSLDNSKRSSGMVTPSSFKPFLVYSGIAIWVPISHNVLAVAAVNAEVGVVIVFVDGWCSFSFLLIL